MSPWSALLRVVLILVLVLNGAGTAAASVTMMRATMPADASMATSAALKTSAMQEIPCHDMAGMTAKAASPDTAAQAPVHAKPGKDKPMAPDCCRGGTCQCACMQAAHAALPTMPALALVSPHSDVPHPMRTGHADPALPHLIRPPIG